MKQIIVLLLLLWSTLGHSQPFQFRAYEIKTHDPDRGDISHKSNAIVVIDLDKGVIAIHEGKSHYYNIIKTTENTKSDVGTEMESRTTWFKVTDENGDVRTIVVFLYANHSYPRGFLTEYYDSENNITIKFNDI